MGDISEYCYQLNDVEDGRRLLKKYLYHIDDTYDKNDIEYVVVHAMAFKYLESDKDWETLTDNVIEGSSALRERIATNFTGMTSAQREYLLSNSSHFLHIPIGLWNFIRPMNWLLLVLRTTCFTKDCFCVLKRR